jgi:YHS domain-containing protein
MDRALLKFAMASAVVLGLSTGAFAATGEFDDMCALGVANGKEVKTDCSINTKIDGKTYCFGNEAAKTEFMKDPAGNLAKANENMSKKNM